MIDGAGNSQISVRISPTEIVGGIIAFKTHEIITFTTDSPTCLVNQASFLSGGSPLSTKLRSNLVADEMAVERALPINLLST